MKITLRYTGMKITHRYTGATLYEDDAPTLRKTAEAARRADADLGGAYLRGADLGGAYLRGADLRDADLRDANLRGANLRGANLRCANLGDADLRDANLMDANLRGANLGGAYLMDANLEGANLEGADLGGANLGGAYLRGAKLSDILAAVPLIANLDAAILTAVEHSQTLGKDGLDMRAWHTCESTHCRAGWAVHLAGKEGYALEGQYGPAMAGTLIYLKAGATKVPNWYASEEEALADLQARAHG